MRAAQDAFAGFEAWADRTDRRSVPTVRSEFRQDSLSHIERPASVAAADAHGRLAANRRHKLALLVGERVGFTDQQFSQREIISKEVVLQVSPLGRRERLHVDLSAEN